jgi:4-hydroxy-2-oxoheptanedioate aldolase
VAAPVDQTAAELAVWLSTPNFALCEIARSLGFGRLVLDVEHGAFGTAGLDRIIAFAKALGFEVHAKVLGPEAVPIQQALDFGADGVIIPHIEDLAHARAVTAFAKYPPLGRRSFAGGRTVAYDAPSDDFFDAENRRTRCQPMIESAAALADVSTILDLPTVDGVFVGPSDLSLSRGRGKYRQTPEDSHDLETVARAASDAGKPWIMPGWTRAERLAARRLGAAWMVVADETGAFLAGLSETLAACRSDPVAPGRAAPERGQGGS